MLQQNFFFKFGNAAQILQFNFVPNVNTNYFSLPPRILSKIQKLHSAYVHITEGL